MKGLVDNLDHSKWENEKFNLLYMHITHPTNFKSSSFFKPRFRIAHRAKTTVWPVKNGRLRRFFSIRGRRIQRGGLFRHFVLVITTIK